MSTRRKKLAVEGADDIISGLPIHVLDNIFERLPLKNAARTSILSRKWRYLWSASPHLVFDSQFFRLVTANTTNTTNSASKYVNVINKVFFVHHDPVLNFSLYIPNLDFDWDEHIDGWLSFLSRDNINQLSLNYQRRSRYKLLSCVFFFPKLTQLKLKNIIFKPPVGFSGFANLVQIEFEGVEFAACPSNRLFPVAPSLSNFLLQGCIGIENFNIFAPRLHSVTVLHCTEVTPFFFDNFPNLVSIVIRIQESPVAYQGKGHPFNLFELHKKFPKVELLCFNGCYLKLAGPAIIHRELSFAFRNLTRIVLMFLSYNDLDQITSILWLLKTSPSLEKFEILASPKKTAEAESVLTLLEAPDCMGEMLSLRYVGYNYVKGLKAEMLFIKGILAHSPNLESLWFNYGVGERDEQMRISHGLMRFRRSSKKSEIIYSKVRCMK